MGEFLALFCVCAASVIGAGFLIHYFWQLPLARAFARAGFFVGLFLLFWASGLWVNASRHSWGVLTPVFMLMICAVWLGIKYGPGICRWLQHKIKSDEER